MLRHPVVLTSLEEDMKKLGLMVETAPAPRVALSKSEMDELESMGESEDLDPDASPEEVEEAMRRAAGSGKMVKTKRMSSGERAAAKKYYKQNKGRIKKARAKFAKSSRGKKLAKIAARFSKESIEDGLLDVLEAFDVLLDFRGRSFDGADVVDAIDEHRGEFPRGGEPCAGRSPRRGEGRS